MDYQKLAKRLSGLKTLEDVSKELNVSRRTAVNYVYEMHKLGLVETRYGLGKRMRLYYIRPVPIKKTGNPGLCETLNKYSRVKLQERIEQRVHGAELSPEDAIVLAITDKSVRALMAAIDLFDNITDWKRLAKLAKENGVGRHAGALYDIARKVTRTWKMDERVYNGLLNSKAEDQYIIKGLRSNDFQDIERKWNVFIPLNWADLEEYYDRARKSKRIVPADRSEVKEGRGSLRYRRLRNALLQREKGH